MSDVGMESMTKEEPVSPRKVIINYVENGYVLEIGCKVFVAEKWEMVSEGLELYFKDPVAATKSSVGRRAFEIQ